MSQQSSGLVVKMPATPALIALIEDSERIMDHIYERLVYSTKPGGMPFERQLHWNKCHTWHRPGTIEGPDVQIAETRDSDPNHWDGNQAEWLANWLTELDRWPRRYDPD